eukprot:16436904-Heterocapsa_arctica.AAC.1
MPQLLVTGSILGRVIDEFTDRHPQALDFIDLLGDKEAATGAPGDLLEELRTELCAALGRPAPRRATPGGSLPVGRTWSRRSSSTRAIPSDTSFCGSGKARPLGSPGPSS